uniref:Uncharacterized protein n=1 Tax=Oryza punctata TaxID=4537 RepID=A0A0E0LX25_ORYPU
MASDRTLSDDEYSSDNKTDSKVADSDYFSGSLKRKRGRTDTTRSKLEHDQDKSESPDSLKPRSRLNVTYFSNLIEGLSKEQRSIVEKSAFGSLLNFQRCLIPLSFIKWLARHTDMRCSDIVVNGRSIPITPKIANFILGIPNGGLEIKCDNDDGKLFFTAIMGAQNL